MSHPPLETWAWRDKGFVAEVGVDPADRAFRYGMAVFETIAVRGGVALFLEPHLDRLRMACARCEFAVPSEALREVRPIIERPGFESVVRIYVTAGTGKFEDAAESPAIFVLAERRA